MRWKRDGFSPQEVEKLTAHANEMSFEVLYAPGMKIDLADEDAVYEGYRGSYFHKGEEETEADPGDQPANAATMPPGARCLPAHRRRRSARP